MSSIDELMAAIAANISQLEQAVAGSQGSGSQAEELSGTFAGLGAEASAGTLSAVQTQLAEAAQLGASYLAKLKEAAATAEAARGPGLSGTSSGGLVAQVGEPLKAVEEPVSEHRAELKGSDDGDPKRGRLQRLGRAGIRNASDLKSQGEDLAKSSNMTIAAFDPPKETGTAVGVPQYPEHIGPAHGAVTPSDFVGTAVVMTAMVFEGAARLIGNRRQARK